MKKKLLFAIVALISTVFVVKAQQTLPVSGEYYVIKNVDASITDGKIYLGGNTTTPTRENETTNPDYHVFLVTQSGTDNKYSFKQEYSGYYMCHTTTANAWVGDYRNATNDYKQYFYIDNQTDNAYCIIKKINTSGGADNGVGCDTNNTGVWFNKSNTERNQWIFDAAAAKIILSDRLELAIVAAQTFYNANSSATGANDFNNVISIANGVYTNGASTSAQIVQAITDLKTATSVFSTSLMEAKFSGNTEFFIKVNNEYYINNPGVAILAGNTNIKASNNGLQVDRNIKTANQIFKISKISGTEKYVFFSTLNESAAGYSFDGGFRHVTENVRFGSNEYGTIAATGGNNAWRTFNILFNGTKYAIQVAAGNDAGATKKGIWAYDSSAKKLGHSGDTGDKDASTETGNIGGANRTTLLASDYILDIISVREVFNEEIVAGRNIYNAQLSNTGNAPGQYSLAVMNAFDQALTTAEAIVNPTKEDLFTYAVAKEAFVFNPFTTTDVSLLETAITNANEYIELIKDLISTNDDDYVPGTYGYLHHSQLLTAISNARSFIDDDQDGVWLINDVTAKISAIETAKTALTNSLMKYNTNQLDNGEYFIKVEGYYVDNPGTLTTVTTSPANQQLISVANNTLNANLEIIDAGQIVTISKESNNRYSFFSALYEEGLNNQGAGNHYRNINENAEFRSDYSGAGELSYRTQNIHFNGTKYAIQDAQNSASKGFWKFDNTVSKLTYSGVTTLADGDFIFELIPVSAVFTQEIAKGRLLFTSAVKGNAEGQYKADVYDAFSNALDLAETKLNPTKEDLFTYAAVAKLFIPNNTLIIAADETKTKGDYINGNYTDVIFVSDETSTGQLIIPSGETLTVNGVVKYQKEFIPKKWYPIGFPFAIESIYCAGFEGIGEGTDLEIYDGTTADNGTTGDFWLKSYDGISNTFAYSAQFEAGVGYAIQFPNDFAGEEVTFISVANPVLSNTNVPVSPLNTEYTLVANPSVANVITITGAENYYMYDYSTNGKFNDKCLGSDLSGKSLKPFEAMIATKGVDAADLRSVTVEEQETAIGGVDVANDQVIEIRYYNLQGIEIPEPATNGIYIVKKIYESKRVEIVKTFINKK